MDRVLFLWPLLLVLFISVTNAQRNDAIFRGAQVLNIKKTDETMGLIAENNLDPWSSNGSYIDVMVLKEKLDSVLAKLHLESIPYKVLISDLEEVIKQNNPYDELTERAGGNLSIKFDRFPKLAAINEYLEYLALQFPRVVSVGVLGYSVQNRSIKYLKVSCGRKNAKAVFIDGGIHAREWISPSSVLYIIRELVEFRKRLPEKMLQLDFYIVPVLNPDGYEFSHTDNRMWRKNRSGSGVCVGVDLNRNFDFHFGGKGTNVSPCANTYPGTYGNSELETQALINFFLDFKERIKAYITFHSYSQLILLPYGHEKDKFPPDYNELKYVADKAVKAMRNSGGELYAVWNSAELYPAAGTSVDWVKAIAGVKYTYTIELRPKDFDIGFVLPPSEIVPTGKEAFEAVKVIAAAAFMA